jgi:hypothetical protein
VLSWCLPRPFKAVLKDLQRGGCITMASCINAVNYDPESSQQKGRPERRLSVRGKRELSQWLTLSALARARGSREYATAAMGTRNDVASATLARRRCAVGDRLANAKIASVAATPATKAALIGSTLGAPYNALIVCDNTPLGPAVNYLGSRKKPREWGSQVRSLHRPPRSPRKPRWVPGAHNPLTI